MSELSRRTFLIRGGAGVAALGALAVLPAMEGTASAAQKRSADTHTSHTSAVGGAEDANRTASSEGLMMYIPDPKKGEIHYMIGSREVVQTDSALVARILRDVS
jgi:hypothetical protein